MTHYAPLPRPTARRLWIVELLATAAVSVILWAAGRLLQDRQEWHGI